VPAGELIVNISFFLRNKKILNLNSFTTELIEAAGSDAGLYAVLED
jgi:hypothetical protein